MWYQFLLENLHFAINLFSSLVMFATAWLYLDTWIARKTIREGLKVLGFLLISASLIIHSIFIETTVLEVSLLGQGISNLLFIFTRIFGFFLILLSLLMDPIQDKPKVAGLARQVLIIVPLGSLSLIPSLSLLFPVLSSLIGFLYLRKATLGFENHLKPVSLAFFILAFSELTHLVFLLKDTDSVNLYNIVASFGPAWLAEHLILLLSMIVLGKWVFGYLLKRIQTQLFMIFTSSILMIFLLTTITFTGLLLKNLQNESISRLETDVRVLSLALDSKKEQTLSDAKVVAENPQVKDALEQKTKGVLSSLIPTLLLTQNISSLVVVNENGQVLARGEDKDRVGDSLSEDPLIKRAVLGESVSSVITKDGVLAPQVYVRSVTPIKSNEKIVGAVASGVIIDNAFVDGVKGATGLEASVYGDNQLSATTILGPDNKSRIVGIKEENSNLKSLVLGKGESFAGSLNILNKPYFVSFLPLKDADNVAIGMLFVGKEQVGVLQAAGHSIELTFILTAVLLVLSILPAYLISRYISYQVH